MREDGELGALRLDEHEKDKLKRSCHGGKLSAGVAAFNAACRGYRLQPLDFDLKSDDFKMAAKCLHELANCLMFNALLLEKEEADQAGHDR